MYITMQNAGLGAMSWELGKVPLIIGRSDGCDIRVYDGSLSRRHAKVWLEDGIARFEDLGSRNATLLNGCPVDSGVINPGDTLALGSTVFRVHEQGTPERTPRVGHISTPVTISAVQSLYVSNPEETPLSEPSHRTVHELHALFHLGRDMGAIDSIRDLANLLESTLRERFQPASLWIAWQYAEEQAPVFQALEGPEPDEDPPSDLLKRALESQSGVISPSVHKANGSRQPQTMMAVPFVHAEEALGGFLLCGRTPGKTYAEDDLQLAMGIAAITAPHVRAIRHAEQLRRDNQALQARAGSGAALLGESQPMKQARELLYRAGASALPVLILGETGTGKEIAARVLHDASPRHAGPYVVVNCAAIPDNLFESEFFGHERGSFTGATQQRMGRFEEAHGGTLFLDEIGDLSLDNQARILRAIETNAFRRVGGEKIIQVDVRIVAATNKALQEPGFRLDLLHRLNAITVHMPPLRARPHDIPTLTRHFIRSSSTHGPNPVDDIRQDALDLLVRHDWPGNVRELKALIQRALLFTKTNELTPEDLQLHRSDVNEMNSGAVYSGNTAIAKPILPLAEIEREHIQFVLESCQGNISAAARALGINRVTLYKRIAQYGRSAPPPGE